jgi:uncharacterized membrane protein AbrB (regulator of aidB expression)
MSGRELVAWVIGIVVVILAVRGWRDTDFIARVYLAAGMFVLGAFVAAMLTRC